jgi:hypothetical protein
VGHWASAGVVRDRRSASCRVVRRAGCWQRPRGACDGPWGKVVMAREVEQAGVEPKDVAYALEHDGLEVVVEQAARNPLGRGMFMRRQVLASATSDTPYCIASRLIGVVQTCS